MNEILCPLLSYPRLTEVCNLSFGLEEKPFATNVNLILESKSRVDLVADDDKLPWLGKDRSQSVYESV